MPGRFLPLFFAAHGQTDAQIGVLIGVSTAVSVFASPLLCNLADRTGRRERFAAFAYALTLVAFLAQSVAWPAAGLVAPRNMFVVLLVLRIVYGFWEAAAYPLVSAITIETLREESGEDGHKRFGEERLWGAVSWAVCSLALGGVLDVEGAKMWIVHVGIALFGGVHVAALLMFERRKTERKEWAKEKQGILAFEADEEQAHERLEDENGSATEVRQQKAEDDASVSIAVHTSFAHEGKVALVKEGLPSKDDAERVQKAKDDAPVSMAMLPAVYRILTEGGLPTILFFNMVFWLSIGMSLVENLLFLFFKFDLNASNFVCGLSVVITVMFEIPLFAIAPKLLQRIGPPALAVIGCLAYVVRGFGYTIVPNGWVVLLFEPLHGVTVACGETAKAAFLAERTPKELSATGQAVATGIETFAFTIGVGVGGWGMQRFGSKIVYRMAGLLVLTAVAAFVLGYRRGGASTRLENETKESVDTNFEKDDVS